MDALIIKKRYLDKIFSGEKIWEIRGSKTNKRCKIGLIESGSGMVKGTCEIIDCIGPLTDEELSETLDKHFAQDVYYNKTYAWVLKNAKKYRQPVKYIHPKGAIIWVKV